MRKTLTARQTADRMMLEETYQNQIIAIAKTHGWLVYHTHDSRRSAPGFPDLVLVRGTVILFLEVKRESGVVSESQSTWMEALRKVTTVDAAVVRPRDYDQVELLLRSAQ